MPFSLCPSRRLIFVFVLVVISLQSVVQAVTECIDGWRAGDGKNADGNGREVQASASALARQGCAELVAGLTSTCKGANGATQRPTGCYCEFNMNDVEDNHDGSHTCLFFGEYKEDLSNVITVIIAGSIVLFICICFACCFLMRHRLQDCYYDIKDGSWQKAGHEEAELVGVSMAISKSVPEYWSNQDLNQNFDTRGPPPKATQKQLEQLLQNTFKEVSTRDREDHIAPCGLQLLESIQVENRDLWVKYQKAKVEIQNKRPGGVTPVGVTSKLKAKRKGSSSTTISSKGSGLSRKEAKRWSAILLPEHSVSTSEGECKTSQAMSKKMLHRLDKRVNEYYLFHGTTPEGAFGILETGFKLDFVGTHRGTMFGRGIYFAESSSKSDEYSSSGQGQLKGIYGVLLCRVVCGEMLRLTKAEPKLIEQALNSGIYDGVLGDREASAGTYREYVVFSEDAIYPEYILLYKRVFPTE